MTQTISATRTVGNETRQYAGPVDQAPTWITEPGTRVRTAGVTTTVPAPHRGTTCTCYYNDGPCAVCTPSTAWDVCSTGRENCRSICCL